MGDMYFSIAVIVWNCAVFFIYGYDKFCAVRGYSRISEFTLLFLAFSFAGLGAALGMFLCNHKTSKWKFKILIPLSFLWTVFAVGFGYGLM